MSKTTEKTEAAPAQPVEDSFPLTLDEFCSQLSKTNKRVALIGGFHSAENAAGRVKDTVAAYQGRFDAFIKQPA